MGGTYSTHRRNKEFIQYFGCKILREEPTRKKLA
jgi:hypothetical protein